MARYPLQALPPCSQPWGRSLWEPGTWRCLRQIIQDSEGLGGTWGIREFHLQNPKRECVCCLQSVIGWQNGLGGGGI